MVFDIVVVLVVVAAAAIGARRGLASQVAGILSLVLGFVVAVPLSRHLAPFFGAQEPMNRLIALAVLYAAVSLTLYALAFRFHERIREWKLEHWDRHLGALVGAAKGCLLAVTLTFFSLMLVPGLREPILQAKTGRLMGQLVRASHPLLPPEVHDVLHPYHHYLD